MSRPPADPERETVVDRQFKRIFYTVLGISMACLALNIVLAIGFSQPTTQLAELIDGCSTVWRMGFGAIIGLISGKAIQ